MPVGVPRTAAAAGSLLLPLLPPSLACSGPQKESEGRGVHHNASYRQSKTVRRSCRQNKPFKTQLMAMSCTKELVHTYAYANLERLRFQMQMRASYY